MLLEDLANLWMRETKQQPEGEDKGVEVLGVGMTIETFLFERQSSCGEEKFQITHKEKVKNQVPVQAEMLSGPGEMSLDTCIQETCWAISFRCTQERWDGHGSRGGEGEWSLMENNINWRN